MQTQLGRLWRHVPMRRRRQSLLLLLLMLLASVAEIASIGTVIPFLAILVAPDRLLQYQFVKAIFDEFSLVSTGQIQLALVALFIAVAIATGAVRVALSWFSTRLAYATGADLSHKIYWLTLNQPYSVHVRRNSSELITAIVSKVSVVIASVIGPVLMLISSALLMVAVGGVLLMVDARVTLLTFSGFGVLYFLLILATKAMKTNAGRVVSIQSTRVVKILQEGLGGIRDILIDNSQQVYCQLYRDADGPMRQAQGRIQFLAQSPRYVIEAIGMIVLALVAYLLSLRDDGFAASIPMLGALAVGAQRLLPVMQNAYVSWSSLTSSRSILEDALRLLEQPEPDVVPLGDAQSFSFKQSIRLHDVAFRYRPDSQDVLECVNLEIPKGARLGVMGATGCGKSTLVDIIMGLLSPRHGRIEIDGVAIEGARRGWWQRHVAHVPQTIFLTDNSIAENIAFGVPQEQIDVERVRQAAAQAQIASDIEAFPDAYATQVGERGVCLSGGQRQRIGIARALYKNADVIVFDEATSALDEGTERAVMAAIDSLNPDLTLIIVAHRLSTLRSCSHIIELGRGGQIQARTFDQISGRIPPQSESEPTC